MRRVCVSACILALTFVVHGSRDVDEQVQLADVTKHEAEEARGDFPCPDECVQCCPMEWGLGMMTSRSSFKCIIGHGEDTPKQTGCLNKGRRSTNSQQDKVECPFTPEQVAQKSSLEQCADWFRCCCDETQDFSEYICEAGNAGGEFEMQSQISLSVEKYKLAAMQGKANMDKPCQLLGNVAVPHQKKPGGALTSEGCCLQTEQGSRSERRFNGYKKSHDLFGGRGQKKYKTTYRHYDRCGQWEMIPHCGAGEKRYERVYEDEGVCVAQTGLVRQGDELCPEGMTDSFHHQRCQCGKGCDR